MFKSKTFWTGMAAIATGIGFIFNGSPETGAELVVGGLVAIFLRHNMVKKSGDE